MFVSHRLTHRLARLVVLLLLLGDLGRTTQLAFANVTLVSFTATGLADRVLVAWATASEFDISGFYVQRSDQLDGPYEDWSPQIAGEGELVGASYTYEDTNVTVGNTYYYRLKVVNNDQTTQITDPVWATPGVTYTPTPSAFTKTATQPPAGNTVTPTPSPTASPTTSGTPPTVTPSPTVARSRTPTRTITSFPVVSFTPRPTITNTPLDTATITTTPTLTPTATTTLAPLPSITLIFPAVPTAEVTVTPTATRRVFATRTPTLTPTEPVVQHAVPLRVTFVGVIVGLLWVLLAAFLAYYLRRVASNG